MYAMHAYQHAYIIIFIIVVFFVQWLIQNKIKWFWKADMNVSVGKIYLLIVKFCCKYEMNVHDLCKNLLSSSHQFHIVFAQIFSFLWAMSNACLGVLYLNYLRTYVHIYHTNLCAIFKVDYCLSLWLCWLHGVSMWGFLTKKRSINFDHLKNLSFSGKK